jgi:hypothetical protein
MPAQVPGTIGRPRSSRPDKREPLANRPRKTVPITTVSGVKAGSVITVTFNQPVALKGVPQYTTDVAGITVVTAVLTSPTVLTLTFSAAIAAATELRIPYEEPAIRNSSGGFVADSTVKLT